jgi:hypothetical protein
MSAISSSTPLGLLGHPVLETPLGVVAIAQKPNALVT